MIFIYIYTKANFVTSACKDNSQSAPSLSSEVQDMFWSAVEAGFDSLDDWILCQFPEQPPNSPQVVVYLSTENPWKVNGMFSEG